MFPAGYANFTGYRRTEGLSRTAKVVCGRGNLESVLGEALYTRGLEFPDGTLTIDKGEGEISIHRRFALSEKGPSVFYSRLYPAQQGFEEMKVITERMLKKTSIRQSGEIFLPLSKVFEEYLIEKLDFTEKAILSRDASPEAQIQGRVKFPNLTGVNVPEEQAEYWICLNDALIEEISQAYQKKNGRNLSARRRNILARKENLLGIDTFLRAIDIYPASGKYEERKVYKNLMKCSSFLMDIVFEDST